MPPQIWLYANTNRASYVLQICLYVYIPTEICIVYSARHDQCPKAIYNTIQMKLYRAAVIIDNARNYILAFKIWQTHATNIHVIRVH